ncbi:LysM domain-containing protein [Microbacterium sp. ru370.1]|uniref:LysM peptidoglycan-binding domain-containing protein n=1 Tax=unclassified Microbacterium TaxID=2609290 RepID=UPI00088AD1F6|nr:MULTISPECIES: LysM peptidoglycan-binding domain-containing protein [unclassified Microbacterium]SDO58619.1 LysM domain-containing protein [Microbacterium sp. ru370.1]SIT85820.1 LysM domain-containing protein [Microbacterium sp. RU1D]
MSSIAITAPTTRLRITARGRRVVAFLVALPLAVALGLAVVGGGAALASNEAGAPAGSFTEITVMSGQTLWSIAEELAPAADPRDVIAQITRLNALSGGSVTAGQRIAIPSEYAPTN